MLKNHSMQSIVYNDKEHDENGMAKEEETKQNQELVPLCCYTMMLTSNVIVFVGDRSGKGGAKFQ